MSDWMTTPIDKELGTSVLHISGNDLGIVLEVIEHKYRITNQPEECLKHQLEIKLSWSEGKFGQEDREQSFYLSGRNIEVFKEFVARHSAEQPCQCGHKYCDNEKKLPPPGCQPCKVECHQWMNECCTKCGEFQ